MANANEILRLITGFRCKRGVEIVHNERRLSQARVLIRRCDDYAVLRGVVAGLETIEVDQEVASGIRFVCEMREQAMTAPATGACPFDVDPAGLGRRGVGPQIMPHDPRPVRFQRSHVMRPGSRWIAPVGQVDPRDA